MVRMKDVKVLNEVKVDDLVFARSDDNDKSIVTEEEFNSKQKYIIIYKYHTKEGVSFPKTYIILPLKKEGKNILAIKQGDDNLKVRKFTVNNIQKIYSVKS